MRAKVSLSVPATEPFFILYINQHTHTGIERYLRSLVFFCQFAIVAKIEAINGRILHTLSQVTITLPAQSTINTAGIILFCAHFFSRKLYTMPLRTFIIFIPTGVKSPRQAKCILHTSEHRDISIRIVRCRLN